MAERLCPVHGTALESRGKLFHCEQCAFDYRISGRCDDCGSELEHVAACGASNWWCNSCNELKSKSRVKTELIKA
jgi:hypothetical protein